MCRGSGCPVFRCLGGGDDGGGGVGGDGGDGGGGGCVREGALQVRTHEVRRWNQHRASKHQSCKLPWWHSSHVMTHRSRHRRWGIMNMSALA
eukprot:14913195-Heterocapsa_arctica.AAC.1